MSKKKYLFFDIDGTLAAGGYENFYIPDSAKLAIDKLKKAGHFLCIATGRAQALAIDTMKDLGFENMVSDGGYGVTINNSLIGIKPLPKKEIVALIRECQEKGFPWGIQIDNSATRTVPDDRFQKVAHDIYMKQRIVEGLDPEDYENIYKAYVACSIEEERTLKSLKNLPWYRFHENYLFVEPSYKSVGIKKVMDYFGADYKDAVVFGDSGNDISMFKDDWTKVAMGNAIPELKELADYVTDDVDKNGIYNACEKLGLYTPVTC
jgi:Cof subfamily protein (haloacid dehalogenase superfamily)